MRRSGTALSFLLSEVSGRRWPYTGHGGGASQQHPTRKHPELPGDPLPSGSGGTKAQRGHSKSETQSRCGAQGCSHYLWVQGTNGAGEADSWVWNQGFLLPKERRPHLWGGANGPILGDWSRLKGGREQELGSELIQQELGLNPRLVVDNLSRTIFLCEKKRGGGEAKTLREIRMSQQAVPTHISTFIHPPSLSHIFLLCKVGTTWHSPKHSVYSISHSLCTWST